MILRDKDGVYIRIWLSPRIWVVIGRNAKK